MDEDGEYYLAKGDIFQFPNGFSLNSHSGSSAIS